MTKDEAKKCLRDYAQYGYIQLRTHCKERMVERGVNMDDVLNVLLWGEIKEIRHNKDHDSWECKVKGKDIDGDDLVFIAGIYEGCNTVRCITVY